MVSSLYTVPWCVPPWGWTEFRTCLSRILMGRIVQGPDSQRFADAVKMYLGVSHALPVNRGRTALELALLALQIGTDDDVVIPAYVCQSVVDAVVRTGAHPVFADIGEELNVTADTVKAALTSKVKCVIVPHLFGRAAPIRDIENMLKGTGIAVIDDAAQSFGARCSGRFIGTFGICGIISCGPGKSLAGPAGGVLVTNDLKLYERAAIIPLDQESTRVVSRRILSFWLWRRFRKWTLPISMLLDKVLHQREESSHTRCAMSNIDAAIALEQLRSLHQNVSRRRNNAHILLSALGWLRHYHVSDLSEEGMAVKLVAVLPQKGPSAQEMIELLAQVGIECQPGYSPLHLTVCGEAAPRLPLTETLWKRIVCIPIDSMLEMTSRVMELSHKWHSLESSEGTRSKDT